MKLKKIIGIILVLLYSNSIYSQGCSDAGFCTINSIKPSALDSINNFNNQIKIGLSYGKADHNISVLGNYVEYNKQINNKFGLDIKITSIAQNGNDISNFGLSDVFATSNYVISDNLNLTFGAKIPLSNANKKKDNLALPLDYQSSLGTLFNFRFRLSY